MHQWQNLFRVRWDCRYRVRQYIREQEELERRQGEFDFE